jgi:hypothetical protein
MKKSQFPADYIKNKDSAAHVGIIFVVEPVATGTRSTQALLHQDRLPPSADTLQAQVGVSYHE